MTDSAARNYDAEEIGFMNVDETDFSSFSTSQRIRHFEVEGYVVLSGVLDEQQIGRLKSELVDAPMQAKDYSDAQTYHPDPQWHSRAVAELIGHPPVIEFLRALTGPDIVFTRGLFTRTLAGSAPISMHTDGQPFGSSLFGFEGSSPRGLRVLYYLDDLPVERAPFRLIPRSHLSFHAEGNPYKRYTSHPQEKTLLVAAGTAVLIPINLFHGTHPNRDAVPREMIQFGYRPAWAGPIQPMEEWDPELIAAAPDVARPFLQSVNTSGFDWNQPHKPEGMKDRAPGIDPDRWGS